MENINNTQGDERVQVYEVGFHVVPTVSADALPAEVNAVRSLIESTGGAIISDEAPKVRDLAYTITKMRGGKYEKFDSAFFGWIKFESSPATVKALKEALDKNENILRHLIIKTVRENTLISKMNLEGEGAADAASPEGDVKAAPVGAATAPAQAAATSAEIDKTIDDLVKE